MLSLLLAAGLANLPNELPSPVAAATPASATVRIVRAAEIRVGNLAATEGSLLRITEVHEGDGVLRRASLVEYY